MTPPPPPPPITIQARHPRFAHWPVFRPWTWRGYTFRDARLLNKAGYRALKSRWAADVITMANDTPYKTAVACSAKTYTEETRAHLKRPGNANKGWWTAHREVADGFSGEQLNPYRPAVLFEVLRAGRLVGAFPLYNARRTGAPNRWSVVPAPGFGVANGMADYNERVADLLVHMFSQTLTPRAPDVDPVRIQRFRFPQEPPEHQWDATRFVPFWLNRPRVRAETTHAADGRIILQTLFLL